MSKSRRDDPADSEQAPEQAPADESSTAESAPEGTTPASAAADTTAAGAGSSATQSAASGGADRPDDEPPADDAEPPPEAETTATEAVAADAAPDTETPTTPTDGENGGKGGKDSAGRPPPPPRRGGRWILALALLIALAAAGGAGYLGWRLYQLEQRVAAVPERRAADLQSYLRPDALRPLQARIESLERTGRDSVGRLEREITKLQQALEVVRARTERHQIGWRLAEIRYLLAIASRRLQIAYDTEGAQAALEAADASVAELQDVRLLPLRKAIVADLGAVREVQPADIEGIALRLQSLLAQVDTLPRDRLRQSPADDPPQRDGSWWQRLREQLGDFVVIQRRPTGPAPIEPKVGEGLRATDALALALRDARRAALARDGERYDEALQAAAEVLQSQFDLQAAASIRFREGLADVRGRSVETELPDLSDTISLARSLANEVEQARKAAAQPAAEE